ncbi:MAG: radical SAM protein [Candidatus Omnitrophica bacterium]|nr:radical SAM protein [Candidatus Omnitrophota bacterium]
MISSRSKKILIVSPPYRISQSTFPLGPMYIAAVLRKAGHGVEIIDMDVLNLSEEDYCRRLQEAEYDYLCTGGMITAWNFIVFTCEAVRAIRPDAKIIVGGGIISATPKSLLSVSQADAGIVGEGEETILDVIDAYENGRPLSTVDGIVYREGEELTQTSPRAYIEDLDSLPFPAWDLFNVGETYARFPSHNSILKARRSATVSTTRGCPFNCTFCYTEKKVRQRSVGSIIEEIKELKNRYGVGYVLFADDLFVVRRSLAVDFCNEVIKSGLNIKWSCSGRCNVLDKEFLRLLKSAGCDEMGIGIESGSPTVLTAIRKNQTPEQIVDAIRMIRETGITPGGTFILGLPPETRETVRETVEIYKKVNRYRKAVNKFFFATPYPGTALYEDMRAKGRIADEIGFFETLSEKGDAVNFCVNCTDAFSDEELIQIKREIEAEVFEDFVRKHPLSALFQFVTQKTPWGKIKSFILKVKMNGLRSSLRFLWKKVLVKLRRTTDVSQRFWNTKRSYSYRRAISCTVFACGASEKVGNKLS